MPQEEQGLTVKDVIEPMINGDGALKCITIYTNVHEIPFNFPDRKAYADCLKAIVEEERVIGMLKERRYF